MTWLRKGSALTVLALGSALVSSGLGGCSLLVPEPPDSVSAAAASAREAVATAPGVESVSADVELRDYRGEGSLSAPDAWVVRLTVNATPGGADLERAADAVVDAVVDARSRAHVDAVVVVPKLDGDADAEIHFGETVRADGVGADRVRAARELTAVAGVSRVTVGRDDKGPRVETTSLEQWPEVAAGIRGIPDSGVGALRNPSLIAPLASGDSWSGDGSDGLHVEVGADSPSTAMIDEITRLATERSLSSIAFSSGEAVVGEGATSAERPSVHVSVESRADVTPMASHLAGLDQQRYWPQNSGRPSFQVDPLGGAGSDSTIFGYLGLPIGSAEPDDLPLVTGVR